jgi:hypothetical protein
VRYHEDIWVSGDIAPHILSPVLDKCAWSALSPGRFIQDGLGHSIYSLEPTKFLPNPFIRNVIVTQLICRRRKTCQTRSSYAVTKRTYKLKIGPLLRSYAV